MRTYQKHPPTQRATALPTWLKPANFVSGIVLLCLVLWMVNFYHRPTPSFQSAFIIEERPEHKFNQEKHPVPMPFYVYSAKVVPFPNHYVPSGNMGDVIDLKMTGWYGRDEGSYEGTLFPDIPCLRITYTPSGELGWAGLMWQNPANNWGEYNGGYDLSRASRITFWARGEKGGEVVEFKVGGISATYTDSVNLTSGSITLEREWVKYNFHLKSFPLDFISGGFSFVTTAEENPVGCVFYLDEIRYE